MSESPLLRVTVLLGGETGEREVSVHSGLAVAGALLALGHRVRLLDPASGLERPMTAAAEAGMLEAEFLSHSRDERTGRSRVLGALSQLSDGGVDLVANLLHGGAGEGGQVTSVLELAGLPYFGSAPAASAIALDKVLAKRLFRTEGIPVAREMLWGARRPGDPADRTEDPAAGAVASACPAPPSEREIAALGGYPLVAKPICGGSTLGLTIVDGPEEWPAAWREAADQIDPDRGLLVEEYIPGRELTVGLLEDRALPVVEIVPKSGFYDYRRKYTAGETDYHVPADLPPETAERIRDWGWRAFDALGCRDMGRADFRLAPDGRCACLEVNTIPGMTATSLLPKAAAAVGISFDSLVDRLCRRALARADGSRRVSSGR